MCHSDFKSYVGSNLVKLFCQEQDFFSYANLNRN